MRALARVGCSIALSALAATAGAGCVQVWGDAPIDITVIGAAPTVPPNPTVHLKRDDDFAIVEGMDGTPYVVSAPTNSSFIDWLPREVDYGGNKRPDPTRKKTIVVLSLIHI